MLWLRVKKPEAFPVVNNLCQQANLRVSISGHLDDRTHKPDLILTSIPQLFSYIIPLFLLGPSDNGLVSFPTRF